MNKSYSVRIDIPDTDLYDEDIEQIIYSGLKHIIGGKIEKTNIDVIELDTIEEQHAPPRLPSSIKLYESKSIEGLLLDHREVKPLAINDWELIQNKLIGVKN